MNLPVLTPSKITYKVTSFYIDDNFMDCEEKYIVNFDNIDEIREHANTATRINSNIYFFTIRNYLTGETVLTIKRDTEKIIEEIKRKITYYAKLRENEKNNNDNENWL